MTAADLDAFARDIIIYCVTVGVAGAAAIVVYMIAGD